MRRQDKNKNEYYNLDKEKVFLVSLKAFIEKENKLIIIKFPSRDETSWVGEWNGTWGLPGGLLEMDEDISQGLKREVHEETSLVVEPKSVVGLGEMRYKGFVFRDGRKLDVRIMEIGYLCEYLSGEVSLSKEHAEYKWATKDDLMKLKISPDSIHLIEQYLKKNE